VGDVSKDLKKTEKYLTEFQQIVFQQNVFQQNGEELILEELLMTNVCPEATANIVRKYFFNISNLKLKTRKKYFLLCQGTKNP
jgi:hypothetical protein